jgi:hypothetical protein
MLGLHAIAIGLALAVNNPDRVIQQAPSTIIEFLGSFLLARAVIRSPEDFLALCRWLVRIVLFLLPFALYETLTGTQPLLRLVAVLPGVMANPDLDIGARMGLERVQAVFAHPIHFGLFCSVAFSMAFVALEGVSTPAWRWTSSALVGGSAFLALSSGALLAVVLQIGLIAWAALFPQAPWRWRLLLGLFAAGWIFVDLASNRTPIQVLLSYATFSPHNAYIRMIIFDWGSQNVMANPLLGIGMNDWFRPAFLHSDSVDNFWLLTAMRYGLPGLLFLALGWFGALFRILRRPFRRDGPAGRIRRAYAFTVIGLTLTLCTVHVWGNIYAFTFFLLGAGIWMIDHEEGADEAASTGDAPSRPARFTRFPGGLPAERGARA